MHEKANPSDVDEASPMVVLATDNANVSNDTSQTIPERYVHSFDVEFLIAFTHPLFVEVT